MKAKKTNILRKSLTVATAAVLVMSMWAFAVSADPTAADLTDGVAVSSLTTLNIPKTLVVSNKVLAGVKGPGLTLSYTLAPANVSAGTVVTDASNNVATVHGGPAGGLTLDTETLTFGAAETLNASPATETSKGAENVKNIVVSVDLSHFTHPGVFRYALTDTTTAQHIAATGTTARKMDEFNPVRYVDVYVQHDSTGTLVVEGYVVGSDVDGDGLLAKETFDTTTPDEEDQSQTAVDPVIYDTRDVFDTYNVDLTKTVTGNMGDENNGFLFAITVNNGGRAYYAAKNAAPANNSASSSTSSSQTVGLKHGDVYYIAGLRSVDTVAFEETNNTDDIYQVSITGGTASAPTAVAPNGTKAMTATAAPDAEHVTFTNNLGNVSPTGVITRFGPYIGMILIAAVLLVVRRRADNR